MKRLILILALCSPIMGQYKSPLNRLADELPNILMRLEGERMRKESLEYQRQQTLINAERLKLEKERFEYEMNKEKREEIDAFRNAGFKLFDTNSDGKYDLYALDNVGNSQFDVRAIDSNYDGNLDLMEFDDDGDGIKDRILFDKDKNGTLEYWLFDNDGDGNWDEAGVDTDGDMFPDVRFPYVE